MSRLLFIAATMLLSADLMLGSPASAAFLERESLRLAMDGRHEVTTSLPLQEFADYLVKVRSPYNLKDLYGIIPELPIGHRYRLLFDGQFLWQDRMTTPIDRHRDMHEMVWPWVGKGAPLTLRAAKDLTADIRHVHVEIVLAAVDKPPPPPPAPAVTVQNHTTALPVVPAVQTKISPAQESSWKSALHTAHWWLYTVARWVFYTFLILLALGAFVFLCLILYWSDEWKREAEAKAKRQRAQAEADAQAARHAAQLKARANHWMSLAHEERYFLKPEYRLSLAKTKTQEILEQWEKPWREDHRRVLGDGELHAYLQAHGPQVMEWLESRLETIELAHRADVGLLDDEPSPKQTTDAWEERQARHAELMAEREYRAAEQAIVQALAYKLRIQALHDDLVQKHPDRKEEIDELFAHYEELKATPSSSPAPEQQDGKALEPSPAPPPAPPARPEIL